MWQKSLEDCDKTSSCLSLRLTKEANECEADQSGAQWGIQIQAEKMLRTNDHLLAGIFSLLDASPSVFHN